MTTPMRIPHLAQRIAPNGTRDLITAAAVIGAFIVATVAIAILEAEPFGIEDASPVYLVAVVAAGALAGTLPALVTAVAAFLLYDILFTEPRLSFAVSDPREVLDLVLLLFVGLVVGRLAAVQHARAEEAAERAAEANTLFALSRALATATSTAEAAPDIADRVSETAGLERVWVVAGTGASEQVLADTGGRGAGRGIPPHAGGTPPPHPSLTSNLVRTPGDEPARWVRTHAATRSGTTPPGTGEPAQYRVRIEVGGIQLGTIIAVRDRELGDPSRSETRVLALAADQIAVSLRRDQLRQAATDLEIAHQTDALKTALIDSVSHDLRTPLASIRATAGGLADPDVSWTDEARRSAAHVIDTEATRLDRLVSGLLDLSKIASGGLHPDLEPHELWSVVEPAVERLRPSLGNRSIRVDVPDSLPPVLADAVLLDIVVTNLLDNVGAHSRPDAPVAIHADVDDGMVRLVVEDGGPGVPGDVLGSLFERFRRSPSRSEGSRRGLGIGLSVVRGLVDAMSGQVSADRSPLGGLAVSVRLRPAPAPAETER
jgi:two-component system, OmpR family, sensor histidine kinase KdpD